MTLHYLKPPKEHNDTDSVTLSGRRYLFTWTWNARSSRWWWRMDDAEGMITRLPVCEGYPLLTSVTGTRRPPGELFVFDSQDDGGEPQLQDWDRYDIVYDDLEAAA